MTCPKKAAVKWGVDHEEECRQAYITNQSTQHIDFECNLSGFTINNQHPFLGASPDGITNCQCCGKGLIEIKCPYKHKDITVMEAASSDKDFCLDKSLHLKTNHRYYTQVQFQMFILQLTFCDFVVYTKCKPSPSIVRVPIDVNFCHALISKCELFVKTYAIRELVTRQLENQQQASTQPPEENNNEKETWCLCAEPEYDRMIKCDKSECPYQWFHYKCVNIRRKPKGKWYCLSCSE